MTLEFDDSKGGDSHDDNHDDSHHDSMMSRGGTQSVVVKFGYAGVFAFFTGVMLGLSVPTIAILLFIVSGGSIGCDEHSNIFVPSNALHEQMIEEFSHSIVYEDTQGLQ